MKSVPKTLSRGNKKLTRAATCLGETDCMQR